MYSVMDQVYMKLVTDIIEKKEELIKNKFLQVTGEDLTEQNSSRVVIHIPYYTSIHDKREVWTIDGVPVLEIYAPLSDYSDNIEETWKITTQIKYKEL